MEPGKKSKIVLIGGHICAGKLAEMHATYPHIDISILDIDDPEFQDVRETEINTRHFIPIDPITFKPEGKKKFRDDFDKIPCPKPKGKKRFKNHR